MSSEWTSIQLGDIGRVVTGKTPPTDRDDFFGGDIPFLTPTDMVDGHKSVSTSRTLSLAGLAAVKNCLVPKGVAVSCIGWQMGKSVLVNVPTVSNQQINTVVVDESRFDLSFVYYLLASMRDQIFELGATATRTPIVNKSTFSQIKVLVPSLLVQRQIAEFCALLDDRITLLRETNATLEAIAQALFKSWFVDFDPVHANAEARARQAGEPSGQPRVPQAPNLPRSEAEAAARAQGQPEGVIQRAISAAEGMLPKAAIDATAAALFPNSFEESELGLVPNGWRVGTLSELASFQNGYAFKSQDWTDTGHPVVKIGDVKPGLIDFSGCSRVPPTTVSGLERFKLSRGDLLVGMTGYVGATGLVPGVEPEAYINQRVGRLVTREGLSDIGTVYCAVRDPAYKAYAESQSHGSAQANVSGAALLAYPLVIPSPDVLCSFNRIVEPFLESILFNHEQAQTLTQLRDTLLPRLISGQLRLREAESLVEAAL